MQFLVIRSLTQSELGWFLEVRRRGRETSKQRAINFDLPVVETLFPSATAESEIPVRLTYKDDDGGLVSEDRLLKRFSKNWRLMGGGVAPARFGDVDAEDLFVGCITPDQTPAQLLVEVYRVSSKVGRWLMGRPEASDLANQGMVVLTPSQSRGLAAHLTSLDTDIFGGLEAASSGAQVPKTVQSNDELIVPPQADGMMDVIASLGHDLNVAVADLVDNSIEAGATRVDVVYPAPSEERGRYLAIIDNGHGMGRTEVIEAMRFAGTRGDRPRVLGKYGIGLKAASLSQARVLTVASRSEVSDLTILRWDKGHVERIQNWHVLEPELQEWEADLVRNHLGAKPGTAVLWQQLESRGAVRSRSGRPDQSAHGRTLTGLKLHLGMVFHRFLSGEVSGSPLEIRLNGKVIQAWDPYLRDHAATKELDPLYEAVPLGDRDYPVRVQSWILPRKDQFDSTSAHRLAGFDGKWNDMQGFYIYRSNRLIQAGDWSGLWVKDEHLKLLRVSIDFDPELDDVFDVQAAKMSVSLPPVLAKALKSQLKNPRSRARQAYKAGPKRPSRGRTRQPPKPPVPQPPAPPPSPGPKPGDERRPDGNTAPEVPVVAPPVPSDSGDARPAAGGGGPSASDSNRPVPALEIRPLTSGRVWEQRTDMAGNVFIALNSTLPPVQAVSRAVAGDDRAREGLAHLISAIEATLATSDIDSNALQEQIRQALLGGDHIV